LDEAGKVLLPLAPTESLLILLELLVEALTLLVLLRIDRDTRDRVAVGCVLSGDRLDDGDADEEGDENAEVPPLTAREGQFRY
jgi:hypothetical protein